MPLLQHHSAQRSRPKSGNRFVHLGLEDDLPTQSFLRNVPSRVHESDEVRGESECECYFLWGYVKGYARGIVPISSSFSTPSNPWRQPTHTSSHFPNTRYFNKNNNLDEKYVRGRSHC
jgi:hypothetical protein